MLDLFEQIMASSVWIYVSHILLAVSIAAMVLLFRERLDRFLDLVLDRDVSRKDLNSKDTAVGIAAGIVSFSFLLLIDLGLIPALIIGLIVFLATPMTLKRRRFAKFQREFDASLVESLATLSSSLRAGLTLKDALVVAVQNCPPAFSSEVSRVLKDYRFGKSIDSALDGVRRRVQTPNASIAFGALIIGTQLGGRIPEVLNRIIATIREVDRVEGRLRALTAQGRAQGALLCSMPVVIAVGLYFLDREKIEMMMHSPLGQILIGIAVFLEIVGIAVTVKVMKLDV
jgi:tight adherence protein B